jgi:uncharacterized protein YkwD
MFPLRRHTLIAALVAAGFTVAVPAAASASSCPGADDEVGAVSNDISARATFCLINEQRASHGVPRLRRNARLDLASQRHARSMAARNFFEHGNFVGRIRSANYLQGARAWRLGENIAWGSGVLGMPSEIVDAWMHSPGHRSNILNRGFREIGIGVAPGTPARGYDDGGTYATDFGARG